MSEEGGVHDGAQISDDQPSKPVNGKTVHVDPDDDEAAGVAVGSIGHILRNNFMDVLDDSSGGTPKEDKTVEKGSVAAEEGLEGREGAVDVGESKDGDVGEVKEDDLLDEDARRELEAIDADLRARNEERASLEAGLAEARERAAERDAEHARELRRRGLVQGDEVSLPRSSLEASMPSATLRAVRARAPGAAAQVLPGVLEPPSGADEASASAAGGALLSAAALMEAHERESAVRRGEVVVGEVAPDFFRTQGQPHYLAPTASLARRKDENRRRFLRTTGHFGSETTDQGPAAAALRARRAQEELAAAASHGDGTELEDEERQADREMAKVLGIKKPRQKQSSRPRKSMGDEEDLARLTRTQKYLRNPRYDSRRGLARTLLEKAAAAAPPVSALGASAGSFQQAPSLGDDAEGGPSGTTSAAAVQGSVWVGEPDGSQLEIVHSVRFRGGVEDDKDAVRLAREHPLRGIAAAPEIPGSGGDRRAGPFVVRPGGAHFRDVPPGHATSIVLTLRNADSLGRSLRVLPPGTSFFRSDPPQIIGRTKRQSSGATPLEQSNGKKKPDLGSATGVLAPGMGVAVRIHFHPESLADRHDALVIVTELGKFAVPISATYAPQQIDLPSELALGRCLARDVRSAELPVRNVGSGRLAMRFFPAERWPPTQGSDAASSWTLDSALVAGARRAAPEWDIPSEGLYGSPIPSLGLPPFQITPSHLELDPGNVGNVTVTFAPPRTGAYRRTLFALFSNGQVARFELSGECAELRVGLVAVQNRPISNTPAMGPAAQKRADEARRAARDAAVFGTSIAKALVPPSTGLPNDDEQDDETTSTRKTTQNLDDTQHSLRPIDDDEQVQQGTTQWDAEAELALDGPVPDSLAEHVAREESQALAKGEIPEVWSGPPRVRFETTVPGLSSEATVTIRNETPLPLRYSWVVRHWPAKAPELQPVKRREKESRLEVVVRREEDKGEKTKKLSTQRLLMATARAPEVRRNVSEGGMGDDPSLVGRTGAVTGYLAQDRIPRGDEMILSLKQPLEPGSPGGASVQSRANVHATSYVGLGGKGLATYQKLRDREFGAGDQPEDEPGHPIEQAFAELAHGGDGTPMSPSTVRHATRRKADHLVHTPGMAAPSRKLRSGGDSSSPSSQNIPSGGDSPPRRSGSPSSPNMHSGGGAQSQSQSQSPSPSPPGSSGLKRVRSGWDKARHAMEETVMSKYRTAQFFVDPAEGSLPAKGEVTFTLRFRPDRASVFEAVARLMVCDVPRAGSRGEVTRARVPCATVYLHGSGGLNDVKSALSNLPSVVPRMLWIGAPGTVGGGSVAGVPSPASAAPGEIVSVWTEVRNSSPVPLSFRIVPRWAALRRAGAAAAAAAGAGAGADAEAAAEMRLWAAHARGESLTLAAASGPQPWAGSASGEVASKFPRALSVLASRGLAVSPEACGDCSWLPVSFRVEEEEEDRKVDQKRKKEDQKGRKEDPRGSGGCPLQVVEMEGMVAPGGSVPVCVKFAPSAEGTWRALYDVSFAVVGTERVLAADAFAVQAEAVYPALAAAEPELDIGLCRTLAERTAVVRLDNPHDVPVPFEAFVVPHELLAPWTDEPSQPAQPSAPSTPQSTSQLQPASAPPSPSADHRHNNPFSSSSSAAGSVAGGSVAGSVGSRASTLASALGPEAGGAEIEFDPPHGVVPAGETVAVTVRVRAGDRPQRIRETVGFRVPGASVATPVFVRLRGEVQAPLCHLGSRRIDLGVCFVGVPCHAKILVRNLSNLSSAFRVDPVLGQPRDAPHLAAEASPDAGDLGEKEERTVDLTFTPLVPGAIDAAVAVHVTGLIQPLVTRVTAIVRPLRVAVASSVVRGQTQSIPQQQQQQQHAQNQQLFLATVPHTIAEQEEQTPQAKIRRMLQNQSPDEQPPQKSSSPKPQLSATSPLRVWQRVQRACEALESDPNVEGSGGPELVRVVVEAVEAEAEVGRVPALDFGSDFLTFSRRTMKLTVYNLSGVPTDFFVAPRQYPAFAASPAAAAAGLEDVLLPAATSTLGSPGPSSASMASSPGKGSRGGGKAGASGQQGGLSSQKSRRSSTRMSSSTVAGLGASSSKRRSSAAVPRAAPRLLTAAGEREGRFQSAVGREELRKRHAVEVMREQLSLRNGCAFQVWPAENRLPPFGCANVYVSCVADMPGTYTDILDVLLDGHAPLQASLRVEVVGSPLDVLPTAAGLDFSSRPRLLRFGAVPAGSATVAKTLTVVNTAPADAIIRWNVALPRAPSTSPPLLDIRITPSSSSSGADDSNTHSSSSSSSSKKHSSSGAAAATTSQYSLVDVSLRPHSLRDPPRPPPIRVVPEVARIDAHGTLTFRIEAEPRVRTREEAMDEIHLGWPDKKKLSTDSKHSIPDDDWEQRLGPRRALLLADALFLPKGTEPPADLLDALHDYTLPATSGDAHSDFSSSSSPRPPSSSTDGGPPKTVAAAGALRPRLSRDALPLVVELDPVAPFLSIDKKPDANGVPWIKFGVWATRSRDDKSYVREITLTNEQGVALTFALDVDGPFSLVRMDTKAPRVPPGPADLTDALRTLQHRGLGILTLPPSTNVTAVVRFDPALLRSGAAKRGGGGGKEDGGFGGETRKGEMESTLARTSRANEAIQASETWRGMLNVHFASGVTQNVGLRAQVLRPRLVAAPAVLDFGRVHAVAAARSELTLSNPTAVTAEWSVVHIPWPKPQPKVRVDAAALGVVPIPGALEDDPEEEISRSAHDDPSVFGFSLTRGSLQGPTAPLDTADGAALRTAIAGGNTLAPSLIGVRFAPKGKTGLFRSRFRFQLHKGEAFEVVLQAVSTQEEDAAPMP